MNSAEADLRGAIAILMSALASWRSGISAFDPDVRTEVALHLRTLFEGNFDCAPTPHLDSAAQRFATTGEPADKLIAWSLAYAQRCLALYLTEHARAPGWIPSSVLALISSEP